MEQQAVGSGGTHGIGDREQTTENHLGELVGLGVRHDEEDEGRNEGVLGLEHEIQHSTLGGDF